MRPPTRYMSRSPSSKDARQPSYAALRRQLPAAFEAPADRPGRGASWYRIKQNRWVRGNCARTGNGRYSALATPTHASMTDRCTSNAAMARMRAGMAPLRRSSRSSDGSGNRGNCETNESVFCEHGSFSHGAEGARAKRTGATSCERAFRAGVSACGGSRSRSAT